VSTSLRLHGSSAYFSQLQMLAYMVVLSLRCISGRPRCESWLDDTVY